MGDSEVGNRPWLSGKETEVVVDRALRNVREKWSGVRAQRVRIILKVNSERPCLPRPSGLVTRAPEETRADGPGRVIVMVT
jgi:hypothetical protein